MHAGLPLVRLRHWPQVLSWTPREDETVCAKHNRSMTECRSVGGHNREATGTVKGRRTARMPHLQRVNARLFGKLGKDGKARKVRPVAWLQTNGAVNEAEASERSWMLMNSRRRLATCL